MTDSLEQRVFRFGFGAASQTQKTVLNREQSKRGYHRAVALIEWLKQMRRCVLADLAADCGTHVGAVAPVHATPHTRVAFLGMNLVDAGVVTTRAAITSECQRELIGVAPHRVEPQRG